MCGEDLRGGVRSLSPLQRQNHRECRAFPKRAGNVDASLVVFNDAARQRQSQASAVALGRVERAKNIGEMIGSNAAAVVGHFDDGRRCLRDSRVTMIFPLVSMACSALSSRFSSTWWI